MKNTIKKFLLLLLAFVLLLFTACAAKNNDAPPTCGITVYGEVTNGMKTVEFSVLSESQLTVENQLNYYKNQAVVPLSDRENGNMRLVRYLLPADADTYTFRIRTENKVDRAGYIKLSGSEKYQKVFTFSDAEDRFERPRYTTAGTLHHEDSLLLNINERSHLTLGIGETFTVRPLRTVQIVSDIGSNIIIEPTYHYKVLGDCVTVDPIGKNAVLTAVREGVAVIEVSYEAIEVLNRNKFTTFGATDPLRTGKFVVSVGSGGEVNVGSDWDSEFDTVYFTGDTGTFTVQPEGNATVEFNGEQVTGENGIFVGKINEGNNIIACTVGENVGYRVVRGKRVSVDYERVENQLKISVNGLYIPIAKLAGIYNPGYNDYHSENYLPSESGTIRLTYLLNGNPVAGKGSQYDFISKAEMFVPNAAGTLSGGRISLFCFGKELGFHRQLTDEGCKTDLDAEEFGGSFCRLPNITIEVQK